MLDITFSLYKESNAIKSHHDICNLQINEMNDKYFKPGSNPCSNEQLKQYLHGDSASSSYVYKVAHNLQTRIQEILSKYNYGFRSKVVYISQNSFDIQVFTRDITHYYGLGDALDEINANFEKLYVNAIREEIIKGQVETLLSNNPVRGSNNLIYFNFFSGLVKKFTTN